jgi:hypothetical protein
MVTIDCPVFNELHNVLNGISVGLLCCYYIKSGFFDDVFLNTLMTPTLED